MRLLQQRGPADVVVERVGAADPVRRRPQRRRRVHVVVALLGCVGSVLVTSRWLKPALTCSQSCTDTWPPRGDALDGRRCSASYSSRNVPLTRRSGVARTSIRDRGEVARRLVREARRVVVVVLAGARVGVVGLVDDDREQLAGAAAGVAARALGQQAVGHAVVHPRGAADDVVGAVELDDLVEVVDRRDVLEVVERFDRVLPLRGVAAVGGVPDAVEHRAGHARLQVEVATG